MLNLESTSSTVSYLRSKLRWSRERLARELRCSAMTIFRWENQKTFHPQQKWIDRLIQIASDHGIPIFSWELSIFMLQVCEQFDFYTARHCRRCAALAMEMTKYIDTANYDIDALMSAAFLHDIGKTFLSRDLLNKPGKFNAAQFEKIKDHSKAGSIMVIRLLSSEKVGKIVCQHHEKLNGQGYPKKLLGDNIMFEAQLLSCVDIWDALTSKRPYRNNTEKTCDDGANGGAFSVEEAIHIMKKDKGLNQELVNVLVEKVIRAGFLDSLESDDHLYLYENREKLLGIDNNDIDEHDSQQKETAALCYEI